LPLVGRFRTTDLRISWLFASLTFAVPIVEQSVKQAHPLAKEFLNDIGLSIPWLGDALPLSKLSV
jgi:hypothetical protein